jgi:hypothetical protein
VSRLNSVYSSSDAGLTCALHVLDIRAGAVTALRADGEPYFLILGANPDGSAVLGWPTNSSGITQGTAVVWTAHRSEQIRIPSGPYQLAW